MAIEDFERWREELLFTGRIVADADTSVAQPEAEARFLRYVALVDSARGIWEQRVFRSLLDSLQVDDDYGAYEGTIGVLIDFPPACFGPWLVEALPELIHRQPDRAGDLLSLMVNERRHQTGATAGLDKLASFTAALTDSPDDTQSVTRAFIAAQEHDGWLAGKGGYFGHAATA